MDKIYKNSGAYLRELYDSLVSNLHRELSHDGYEIITPSHGLVFQYIEERGSRITTLAANAQMTKQSMSALIYQLEEYGFLRRKSDSHDARAVLFVLTAKGELLRTKARSINHKFEKKWEQTLGAKRYKEFRNMLKELAGFTQQDAWS